MFLTTKSDEQYQQSECDKIYQWGKEHPAPTDATVQFPSALKTRAMVDSGCTINTITRKEQMQLTIVPKFAQFAIAAGKKDVIGEIRTKIKSQKYSGAISLAYHWEQTP